jgi:hypothetical protein
LLLTAEEKSSNIFIYLFIVESQLFLEACGKKDAYEWPFKKQSFGGKWPYVEITLRCLVERSQRQQSKDRPFEIPPHII